MAGLYHYTTGAGLLGMLKDYSEDNPNLTMRATHYMYMNDPKEYIYGQEICLDIIDEIEEELNIAKNIRVKEIQKNEYAQILSKNVIRILRSNTNKIRACPYLISLSRAKDALHMWNMYAMNGNGLAIKFNRNKLKTHYSLEDCIYNEGSKEYHIIKELIKPYYIECAEKLDKDPTIQKDSVTRAGTIANSISLLVGICIKNASYKEEKETRIIASSADKILFRDKNGLIIPYVEQKIPFECVENIIVGPTADFNRTRESILLLLDSNGIFWDEKKIIESKVPYRL